MTRALSISLLGSFSVLLDGKPVHALETPRLRSLMGYLILHRDNPVYRDGLAEALWPELTEGESRSNLRKLLYRLTQGLPDLERYVEISHTRICWRADANADLDVVELEQVCRTPPTREGMTLASSLYRGDLLNGADDAWILPERERLQHLFAGYLEAGIGKLEEDRDYSTALVWAQRLVSLDPLNEKAYGREMRLHALCGDKAAAMRTYRACVTMLEKELGETCDPALTAEYERIRGTGLIHPPLTPRRHRLVGRHHEWRLLLDTWQRASAGQAALVLLKAEPGQGKTRLAEELTVWVERQGFATAFVRCQETSTELAFSTVADLLHTLPLQSLAPLWLTELTRLLPELADAHPDLPPARPMVEPWQQLRFYQAITRAFLLRQPLLLVIDDVHWCDPYTLKWLHHLYNASPTPRVLTLCTLRSGDEPPGEYLLSRLVPSLQRTGQLVALELPALEPQFTLELASLELASLEPPSPDRPAREPRAPSPSPVLPPSHAERLVQESGGNPLFVLELIRGQQLTPAATTLPAIPPTLQGLIVSRLKSLSPAGYHVINLAAVAGACFSLSLLMHALSDEQKALVDGLDELVRRQLIREREPKVYEFTHPRLHDIVYGELSSARRGLLHRLVAETLGALPAAQEAPSPQLIAFHFEKAGVPAAAVPYLLRAAEAAGRTLDAEEAVRLYSRALELLEGQDQPELAWNARLGREYVLGLLGRSTQRQADQDALERLLERLPDEGRQATLLSRQAQLDAIHGHLERAESRTQQALKSARALHDRRLELELLRCLCNICHRKGDFGLRLDYAEELVECARQLHDLPEEIMALSLLGSAYACLHRHAPAIEVCEKAVALARSTSDLRLESIAVGSLAIALQRARRLPEAATLFARAAEAAHTLQDPAMEQSHMGNLGNTRSQLRQLTGALQAYEMVERLNAQLQDGISGIMLLFFKGGILGTLGRYAEVFAMYEEAIDQATQRGIPFDVIELSHRYATFLNEVGQWTQAAAMAQRGLTLVEGLNMAPVPGHALRKSQLQRNLGVALLGQDRYDEGMALLEGVLTSLSDSPSHRPYRLQTYAFMADASLNRGDWQRFVEPLEALLPAQWSELLRPEFVYLVSYRLLTAAGRRSEALQRLREGAALLQETVSQLQSAEDINAYLTQVPPNRRLCEALRAEGLTAPVPPPSRHH